MNNKFILENRVIRQSFSFLVLMLLFASTGCETQKTSFKDSFGAPPTHTEPIILREGDVLKISFPGTANLDTTQPIRRDGNIVMSMVGEVKAVGLTPSELEKKIIELYSKVLVASQEVTVTIQTSAFPVFVSGAVMHAGKIMCDHPMTIFEAIMEAGGPDYSKAKLTSVTVIRYEDGHYKKFTVNVKSKLDNKDRNSDPFYLKSSDVVRVPEKFSWF